MAIEYKDLLEIQSDGILIDRVATALLVAVKATATIGTPTASESTWILKVLSNPTNEAKITIRYVLVDNIEVTNLQAIKDLTDEEIQISVNEIVPAFTR